MIHYFCDKCKSQTETIKKLSIHLCQKCSTEFDSIFQKIDKEYQEKLTESINDFINPSPELKDSDDNNSLFVNEKDEGFE